VKIGFRHARRRPAGTTAGATYDDQVGNRTAVVLLSGGLDSATCLAIAAHEGFAPIALSFRYGQRHAVELEAAAAIAAAAAVEHVVVDIDLGAFGGSALTSDLAVPKHDVVDAIDATTIPVTYVPARNTIFLSFALALAEVRGARDLFIGVNALDYSGYPDCRPEFIDAFTTLANLATRAGVEPAAGEGPIRVHTPLIDLTKGQIVALGLELGVEHALTTSCYDPVVGTDGWAACGRCDSCLLRRKGFAEVGRTDPIRYTDDRAGTSEAIS
jgi:7-cyano-7-deazaguanine synthase